MNKIGIFFGTDTGSTRLIAKMIAKKLGSDTASKPLNINRIRVEDLLIYDALILGTPTYGEGQLPGQSTKIASGSWEEFLPQLKENDLTGKIVAIYGLGDQEKYKDRFADGLYELYTRLKKCGGEITGDWSTNGYQFEKSKAVVDGRFVGLVLDQSNQRSLSENRIDAWLEKIKPALLPNHNYCIICAGKTLYTNINHTGMSIFMYIAMNRFRIALGSESEFIEIWKNRETHLDSVPGFKEFHLLQGTTDDSCTLFASHSVWESGQAFENWTKSEAFRKAHSSAGGAKNIYLGPPQFEGFEVVL